MTRESEVQLIAYCRYFFIGVMMPDHLRLHLLHAYEVHEAMMLQRISTSSVTLKADGSSEGKGTQN